MCRFEPSLWAVRTDDSIRGLGWRQKGGMERQEVMESRRQRTRTLQRVEWLKLLDIDLRLYLGRRRCAGARAGLVGVLGERGVDVQGAVIREETRREL